MNKIVIIFLTTILLFSCERNDMFEFAESNGITLYITPVANQLSISWTPVPSATAYNVLYSTSNDPLGATSSGDITATSYTTPTLSPATLYYVWLGVKYNGSVTAEIKVSGSATTL